jgi:hypothetical protein
MTIEAVLAEQLSDPHRTRGRVVGQAAFACLVPAALARSWRGWANHPIEVELI